MRRIRLEHGAGPDEQRERSSGGTSGSARKGRPACRRARLAGSLAAGLILAGGSGLVAAPLAGAAPAGFTSTGGMGVARDHATATVLGSGDVLVAGGLDGSGMPTATAEVFDPKTDAFAGAGTMKVAVADATSTKLANGDVLVAGGEVESGGKLVPTDAVQLFDPSTTSWSTTATLHTASYGASAALLSSGKVLYVGGIGSSGAATATGEIYDPSGGGSWSTGSADDLNTGVAFAASAVLDKGASMLVAGGVTGASAGPTDVVELYQSGSWQAIDHLPKAVAGAATAMLGSGDVLVLGGRTGSSGGASGAWQQLDTKGSWTSGSLPFAAYGGTASVLSSGDVLYVGGIGSGGAPVNDSALYDHSTSSWSATANLSTARAFAVSAPLPDGDVLVATGKTSSGVTGTGERYTPATPGTAPSFTSASSADLQAGKDASVSIHASGSPAPTITESGALPPGMAFAQGTNGSATISGTPRPSASSYAVTLTATNGVGNPATQRLVLSFTAAPSITTPAVVHLTAERFANVPIRATGLPTPQLREYGELPPGMSFRAAADGTAAISGVPHPGRTTSYKVTITATNGVGHEAVQHLVLSFASSVSFTSPATRTLRPGAFNDLTITTKGSPAAQLREYGALPPGMRFRANANGTATIYGVPAKTARASYRVTISATNGQGRAVTQHLELIVPQPLAFTSPANRPMKAGAYNMVRITSKGSPVAHLSERGALPPGLVFRADNRNGTATISGVARAGLTGTYHVTVTASNGVSHAVVQHLTLSFSQAPAITTPNHLQVRSGAYVKFTIRASGSPSPAMSERGRLPAGLHFYAGHGIAVIAGTAHFGSQGTYRVTVLASNGTRPTATQALALTVVPGAPPANPRGVGYWYTTSTGRVVWKGDARPIAPRSPQHPKQIVGMAMTPNERGYYLVSSYGGVFNYGDAPFYGSIAHLHLHTRTVAIAAAPSGRGYYEVTRAGNVFPFGNARFYGSTAHRHLPPIAAFSLTPDGRGYWLVTIHGNIYGFGDAQFFGSPARERIPPVVGFAPTPNGRGYWVVTRNGAVLTYGDAVSQGSLANRRVPPVSAFAPTKDGRGYWIVTTQGNVFNLGDARFLGSSAHTRLAGRVEGFVPEF